VPTYYVGGEKRHEGATKKDIIKKIYEEALGN
ncbi:MAG TPA: glutaredoxin, partial [Clostridium sp.]|nr:glutaredoxin [Clostridium sp.]